MFLASVAEDAISFSFHLSDLIGFILIKKLFGMICCLKNCLENEENIFNLKRWSTYVKQKDFKKIGDFIYKEYELFHSYYKNHN